VNNTLDGKIHPLSLSAINHQKRKIPDRQKHQLNIISVPQQHTCLKINTQIVYKIYISVYD